MKNKPKVRLLLVAAVLLLTGPFGCITKEDKDPPDNTADKEDSLEDCERSTTNCGIVGEFYNSLSGSAPHEGITLILYDDGNASLSYFTNDEVIEESMGKWIYSVATITYTRENGRYPHDGDGEVKTFVNIIDKDTLEMEYDYNGLTTYTLVRKACPVCR